MTNKQNAQFNNMRRALLTISKEYCTPAQLRKEAKGAYGIDYEEALEMAYENIQAEAKNALKGTKYIEQSLNPQP